MNIYLLYCVFFMQISIVFVIPLDWLKNTKALKASLKKFYTKTFVSKNMSVSVDTRPFGPLDYPGNNTEKLKTIEKIWKEYYDCLATKVDALKFHKVVPPYAVAAFADTTIELDCAVCVSPEEMTSKADWYVITDLQNINHTMVEEDEHKEIVPYTSALQFFHLRSFHEGVYTCKLKNDYDSPHFLHVLTSDKEPMLEVKPTTAKTGPYALDPLQLLHTKFVLWSEWSDWSKCSYCDHVGRQYKVGYCKISLIDNLPTSIQEKVNLSSTESLIPATVVKETEQLLDLFIYGIPCRSALLPADILNDTNVKKYPTHVMTSFCKQHCPTNVIVEVVDQDGNVHETYNNSAGEFYAQQDLPQTDVRPEKVTLYANLGHPFIIPCPSLQFANAPVEWSVDGQVLVQSTLESVTNHRMTINDLSEIVIQRVEKVDVKIYNCWNNRKQIGSVRLLLNAQPSFLQEYLFTVETYPLVMTVALSITLLYVALRMCLNRRRAQIGALVGTKKKPTLMKMIKDAYNDKLTEAPTIQPTAAAETE